MASADLFQLLRRQHGLITTAQAKEHGISQRRIDRKLREGEWTRVRTGVYVAQAASRTWYTDQLAAVIGRRAVVSHRSAARLWGLEPVGWPRPAVTVPYGSRSLDNVTVHHTKRWDLRGEVERFGIRCTGIERTVLDCAAVTSMGLLDRIAESAIRQRLTSWRALAQSLDSHRERGRNGTTQAAELVERRLGTPVVTRSDFSNRVRDLLIDHGIAAPVVEHPVADASGRHILSVDLAWPAQRLGWELDSKAFHFDTAAFERDRHKRNALIGAGWTVQEITWRMYSQTPARLVTMARELLASRPV